ncbi:S1 family peptidase [Tengunoibacter tsumagoiensis]|uniref:Peptidase S1 domain-containing protein n=1 Tax=Tengunoibacter tsumagoiensis TaxID=2014871 RepID=A0A402A5Y8_9CHLR|nr:trypsin-like serine protease [Tengunoibacter tsumagoiensis]GCE14499.1 hypothetical protein KTT_43580 [Tengunoibacter tsumagoiensis]
MIIRHDRSERDSLVDETQWPAITSFFRGHGGATLIAPKWLLTAAHVVQVIPPDRPISIGLAGKRYPIARIIIHPDYDPEWLSGDEDDEHNIVDLALVELETAVENIAPFGLYEDSDEQGQEVLLLGSGESGNGLRGARSTDRSLRKATNIIDEADAYWLKFRFDEPPDGTFLEGVAGRGDSGGPAFIKKQGHFLLAGISSWQKTGHRPIGLYGCVEHYTRISRFITWIQSTCNLPH